METQLRLRSGLSEGELLPDRLKNSAIRRPSQTPPASFYRRHHYRRRTTVFTDLFKEIWVAQTIVSFCDLRETLILMQVSRFFREKAVKRVLVRQRRQLVLAGLPAKTRSQLWRWVASQSFPRTGVYRMLKIKPVLVNTTPILTDISRTTAIYALSADNQAQMLSILSAIAQYLPEVGYCQSLVFITAVLVKSGVSEEESFWVLHSLLSNYDFSSVIACGFGKLKQLCYQFDCFLNAHLKEVSDKLRQADFAAEIYALRWLLTLFSYELPPHYLRILWDLFFIEKWKVVIRAGLAFVSAVNSSRTRPTGCELFCLLRGVSGDESIAKEVLKSMYDFKVTTALLDGLQGFYKENVTPRLELKTDAGRRWWQPQEEPGKWAKAQIVLDETLYMEDLSSPGGPLNIFQDKELTGFTCTNCGSQNHSSMYCDQDTEASSFSAA